MRVFIVNAFTRENFGGNPAAIVPLLEWPPDECLQLIAAQHNLSETAYIIPKEDGYAIRWFTPAMEVDLCGHATLAAAHILFTQLGYSRDRIRFQSKSGDLYVRKSNDGKIELDFPAFESSYTDPLEAIEQGLFVKPLALFISPFDYMAVFESQRIIEGFLPDFTKLASIPGRGLITTAPGDEVDFVSRCFYPQSGINEDPVTGSAHSVMAPFWARKLGKNKLSAIQVSKRRGFLDCESTGDRVLISGYAVTYMEGTILIDFPD